MSGEQQPYNFITDRKGPWWSQWGLAGVVIVLLFWQQYQRDKAFVAAITEVKSTIIELRVATQEYATYLRDIRDIQGENARFNRDRPEPRRR